jgi:uncharacterized protein (TIGR03437 family)
MVRMLQTLKWWICVLPVSALMLHAQDRIAGPIDQTRTVLLPGHVHSKARVENDRGLVDPSTQMSSLTLHLKPSAIQQAQLEQLLGQQQDHTSPNYHRWLMPEQFADRFGLSSNDIGQVTSWLQSEGLAVLDVARGRHWITFGGTAEQVGHAFHTEIHRYAIDGEMHFANATAPSIPAALAEVASGLRGLHDFRMLPMSTYRPLPAYNAASGNHYIAPDDAATIYDFTPLYNSGIDGSGQKVAIAGQTDISLTDIRAFRAQFNLPPNDPKVVRYGRDPGTQPGDLVEADLDIEWSGAVARNATIIYVNSTDVLTSAQYAIDQNLAPVLSFSYGSCEQGTDSSLFRPIAQQGNAQGITFVAASGDSGAANCDRAFLYPQAAKGPAVSLPASLPEVTGVGGTEFVEGNGVYWGRQNSRNLSSALSYIPEMAWNSSALENQLSGVGGGPSVLYSKPGWQAAPGVPDDKARDVPDIAFSASATHDAYLFYTGGGLAAVGGTSAPTPLFAGIVALLNQSLTAPGSAAPPRLGNINPDLYRLARNAKDVFHDVTTGDNLVPCVQSSPDCLTGFLGYRAGPGYDLVTGLGSMDVYNMVTEWNTAASANATSTTTVIAVPQTVSVTGTVLLTATVTGFGPAPAGTVAFVANDSPLGTAPIVTSSGFATASLKVNASQLPVGANTITAAYTGNSVLDGSAGSTVVTVNLPATGSAVVPSITPNPVYEDVPDSKGNTWVIAITLTEKAGVATTLTGFTIDGMDQSLQIRPLFGGANIPAYGTRTATMGFQGLAVPANRVFAFTGMDASGQTWTQQVTVDFEGPQLEFSLRLASTPSVVFQNPAADPACAWAQQLTLEQLGGFWVAITKLTADGKDITSQVPQIFGTTRLAPFGALHGTLCWSGIKTPSTKTVQLTATIEYGDSVMVTSSATFDTVPALNLSSLSVSPAEAAFLFTNASQLGTADFQVSFSGPAAPWTISVLPASTSSWLTLSQQSGAGPARVTVQASAAGLSNGVYNALLVITSNSFSQFINVPITMVVGASASTIINGVANAASNKTVAAPGMLMSVTGSQLSPSTLRVSGLPLPVGVAGVSATINGIGAPLYYVSPGQLNLQVPYETGAGPAVLGVNNNGQVAYYPFVVTMAAPGIFTDSSGRLTPISSGKRGQTVAMFITGEGDVTPELIDGATPSASLKTSQLPAPRLPVAVTVGGVPTAIRFAGVTPGDVGVTQINFTIPVNAPLGVRPVIVTVGGIPSQPANLTVSP